MISAAPLLKPSTAPSRRDSIRPMKNVKPSSSGTPVARVLGLLDGEHEAEGAAQEDDEAHARAHALRRCPVGTPTQAPSTVGTIDSASSQ